MRKKEFRRQKTEDRRQKNPRLAAGANLSGCRNSSGGVTRLCALSALRGVVRKNCANAYRKFYKSLEIVYNYSLDMYKPLKRLMGKRPRDIKSGANGMVYVFQ